MQMYHQEKISLYKSVLYSIIDILTSAKEGTNLKEGTHFIQ